MTDLSTSVVDHALAYAALDWRVLPIPRGYKYPPNIKAWRP